LIDAKPKEAFRIGFNEDVKVGLLAILIRRKKILWCKRLQK
jgi:hypothetical protein